MENPRFYFLQGSDIFIVFKASKPARGVYSVPTKWILGVFFPRRQNGWSMKLSPHHHLVHMSAAIHVLLLFDFMVRTEANFILFLIS